MSAALENLQTVLAQTCKAKSWLERSYAAGLPLREKTELTEADWDCLETLSGRYARLCDLIVHKLFRALDRFEIEPPGTILDSLNRAERRGLIDSVDEMRALKDLRNEIAHEYAEEDLRGLHAELLASCPKLFKIVEAANRYVERLGSQS
jgi:hypothetical protein